MHNDVYCEFSQLVLVFQLFPSVPTFLRIRQPRLNLDHVA